MKRRFPKFAVGCDCIHLKVDIHRSLHFHNWIQSQDYELSRAAEDLQAKLEPFVGQCSFYGLVQREI